MYVGYGSTYSGNTFGGYGSSYSSPYNRYGSSYGYGNRMGYGSTGYGYGNTYGSYGGYGGGYGSTYGNRFGMGGMQGPMGMGPNGELPLTAQMEQSTQATFQMLDQIVQAFGGFAQMLESTFFATQSSFMAMVGVAEQFGHLRNYLGQVFSLVAAYTTLKKWYYGLRGRALPVDAGSLNASEFSKFAVSGVSSTPANRKPLWIFLAMVIGLPWAMSRLISILQKRRLEQQSNQFHPNDLNRLQASQIKDLEFVKAMYDFRGTTPEELSFSKGDVIAILQKFDPAPGSNGASWWRGRTQSGHVGLFPSNRVELIPKKPSQAPAISTGNGAQHPAPFITQGEQSPLNASEFLGQKEQLSS